MFTFPLSLYLSSCYFTAFVAILTTGIVLSVCSAWKSLPKSKNSLARSHTLRSIIPARRQIFAITMQSHDAIMFQNLCDDGESHISRVHAHFLSAPCHFCSSSPSHDALPLPIGCCRLLPQPTSEMFEEEIKLTVRKFETSETPCQFILYRYMRCVTALTSKTCSRPRRLKRTVCHSGHQVVATLEAATSGPSFKPLARACSLRERNYLVQQTGSKGQATEIS
jgi:hypothetical protein